ncbi:MAG: peptidoglycan-binding protein [Xanthomonadales bacterium]|nr:peptidoglycan-binding protein [Gammaproteobacteria bacterium]NND58183.1 peptidoglycan-binding protein [Xanthomonadales bacterium]NNK50040.1 peptidoglycan-binding protein [Xanthomonadales bacterium]
MNKKYLAIGLATAIASSLAGCSSTDWKTEDAADIEAQKKLITEQQNQIDSLENRLQVQDSELKEKDRALMAKSSQPVQSTTTGLFPPNAEPGHCYARILTPARYQETTETVLAREASERVEIIPARYETVKERVLVKEASSRLETIPARYETVEERVLVRPESTRIEEVPATYKSVSEQVLIAPARTEWKRGPASSFGDNVMQSMTTDTGEVMCLVEVPAQYKTVTRTVVDKAAHTRELVVPAEYKTIKKTVLVEAAKTREIPIEAEYGTVEVTKLVSPAQEKRIAIPAEYSEVTKRNKVSDDVLEWREVLCQVNLTASNVRTLQSALQQKGYDVGNIDGVIGKKTIVSANKFAQSNGLPYGSNYIAIETAKKLGLSL